MHQYHPSLQHVHRELLATHTPRKVLRNVDDFLSPGVRIELWDKTGMILTLDNPGPRRPSVASIEERPSLRDINGDHCRFIAGPSLGVQAPNVPIALQLKIYAGPKTNEEYSLEPRPWGQCSEWSNPYDLQDTFQELLEQRNMDVLRLAEAYGAVGKAFQTFWQDPPKGDECPMECFIITLAVELTIVFEFDYQLASQLSRLLRQRTNQPIRRRPQSFTTPIWQERCRPT